MGEGLKRAVAAAAATRAKTPLARARLLLTANGYKVKLVYLVNAKDGNRLCRVRLFGTGSEADFSRIHRIVVGCDLPAPDIQFVVGEP